MARTSSWVTLAALVASCTPHEPGATADTTPTATASAAATATATATATASTAATADAVDASRPAPDAFQLCFQKMGTDCGSLAPKTVACPKTIEGTKTGACGWAGVTAPATCNFGTTRCECARATYCGGPPPPPSIQFGMSWACRAPLGPNDCPRDSAEAKTATCSVAGKKCSIDECASRSDCTCTSGAWKCTVTMLPPRP